MPTQLAESTEVLDWSKVGVTVAGGGGAVAECCNNSSNNSPGGFGGGEVRVRVGMGHGQEIGVSAFGGAGSSNPINGAFGGKLAYKIAPLPWLAFVANGGAYDYIGWSNNVSNTAVFGGDLAAIVAGYVDSRGTQIYGGVRGAFAVPVFTGAHGASESLTVPIGVMLKLSDLVRVFFEGGFVASWGQYRSESPPPDNYSADLTLLGGYGTAAVQFVFR